MTQTRLVDLATLIIVGTLNALHMRCRATGRDCHCAMLTGVQEPRPKDTGRDAGEILASTFVASGPKTGVAGNESWTNCDSLGYSVNAAPGSAALSSDGQR